MKCCRFCQEDILDKSFQIIEPDGAVSHFCKDCADGLIEYITSGRAEKDVESRINNCTLSAGQKLTPAKDANDAVGFLLQTMPNAGFGGISMQTLMQALQGSGGKSFWNQAVLATDKSNDDNGPPF